MEPTPQQVEEDVLVGPCQPPPPKLEMPSRRNGLLKDLVVLGNVPVLEAIVSVRFTAVNTIFYPVFFQWLRHK